MAGTIEEKVAELVTPLVESMDLTVWGIRFRGGNDHAMLQVFVDSEQGVSADKCGELMDIHLRYLHLVLTEFCSHLSKLRLIQVKL